MQDTFDIKVNKQRNIRREIIMDRLDFRSLQKSFWRADSMVSGKVGLFESLHDTRGRPPAHIYYTDPLYFLH